MKEFLTEVAQKLKENLLSKKLWAWAVATVLLIVGKLPAELWVAVTGIYIGADMAQKTFGK